MGPGVNLVFCFFLIFQRKAEKEAFCRLIARDIVSKALLELDKTRDIAIQCELLIEGPQSSSTPTKGIGLNYLQESK